MSDELGAALRALQAGADPHAQRAFGAIAALARHAPADCAAELARAVRAELAAGALRTPRLLTLLGLTRAQAPDCVPACLALLRSAVADDALPPTDALLGAAAVVARTQPRALLPDLAAIQRDASAARQVDRDAAAVLPLLLAITSDFLRELPDSAVADLARALWADCAAVDLPTVADFAGLQAERAGAGDPMTALMVDLVECVTASADDKRYAGQRLQEAGADDAVVGRLKNAWRAACVAPPQHDAAPDAADPDPPPPDPRVDEWLAAFAEAEGDHVELMRAAIDAMFDEERPPAALAGWLALTVDALPPRRRRTDIRWALVRIGTLQRRRGESAAAAVLPPSVLQRWLDTPQLLDEQSAYIALELLAAQRPDLVVRRDLQRAVAVSGKDFASARHADIAVGGLWRPLAAAAPAAVLGVASRWIAAGFGRSAFLELLLDLLTERARAQPTLADTLEAALATAPDLSADATGIARELLQHLRGLQPADRTP